MAAIYSWLWPKEQKAMKSTDAAHAEVVRRHFNQMLDHTEPPETFTPKQVAQLFTQDDLKSLGYQVWQDVIPALYELAWELREFGDLRIFCQGVEVPEDVLFYEVKSSIRIMRRGLE